MAEKLIDALKEVLGEPDTQKMLKAKGGQEVYIPTPENLAAGHWLAEILGRDQALKLCRRFQRERLSLPMGPLGGRRSDLHRQVVDMSLEGRSVNYIVENTGLHARTVRRVRARYLAG
jgi:hypothetical protein